MKKKTQRALEEELKSISKSDNVTSTIRVSEKKDMKSVIRSRNALYYKRDIRTLA